MSCGVWCHVVALSAVEACKETHYGSDPWTGIAQVQDEGRPSRLRGKWRWVTCLAKLAPERHELAARHEGLYTLFSPCKAQQCVTHMCDSRFSGGSSSIASDVVTGSLAPWSRPQELHIRISAQSLRTRVSSLPVSSICFQKERVASDGSRIHKHSGRHTPSFTAQLAGTKGLPDIIAVALNPRGLARASRIAKRRISISHPVEPHRHRLGPDMISRCPTRRAIGSAIPSFNAAKPWSYRRHHHSSRFTRPLLDLLTAVALWRLVLDCIPCVRSLLILDALALSSMAFQ